MDTLVFVLIGVAAFVAVAVVCSRRRVTRVAPKPLTEPRSMMHVLEGEEELRAALNRAAEIERTVAEAALARAAQYEEMLPPTPVARIADLGAAREKAERAERESRSA